MQLLLGMFRFEGDQHITVPQWLQYHEGEWLVEDELEARAELSLKITGEHQPDCYVTWLDLRHDQYSPDTYRKYLEAEEDLIRWTDGVLGANARTHGSGSIGSNRRQLRPVDTDGKERAYQP